MADVYVVLVARSAILGGHEQRGASAVEYAILVGFIAAVIIGGVTAFGLSVNDLFAFDFTPGP